MRAILNIALLLIAFAIGQGAAADLPVDQARLIMAAAASAPKDGTTAVTATLTINGNQVVFNVTRDGVGNVIARPVVAGDTKAGGIAQISFGTVTQGDGSLVPQVMVQVNTDLTVKSQSISTNPDGTISSFGLNATLVARSGTGTAPVTATYRGTSSFTFNFTLPAGANPGQVASPASP